VEDWQTGEAFESGGVGGRLWADRKRRIVRRIPRDGYVRSLRLLFYCSRKTARGQSRQS